MGFLAIPATLHVLHTIRSPGMGHATCDSGSWHILLSLGPDIATLGYHSLFMWPSIIVVLVSPVLNSFLQPVIHVARAR